MEATSAFDHFTKPEQEFKGHKPDFAGFEKDIKKCIGSISGEFGVKYLFTDWSRNLINNEFILDLIYSWLVEPDPNGLMYYPGTVYPIFVQPAQPLDQIQLPPDQQQQHQPHGRRHNKNPNVSAAQYQQFFAPTMRDGILADLHLKGLPGTLPLQYHRTT